MGGLPCAKTIIDQRNAVVQAMDCMSASILLAAPNGSYPSDQMEDEFVAAAQNLAEVAAKIEKHVREGSGSGGEQDAGQDRGASKGKDRTPGNGEGL